MNQQLIEESKKLFLKRLDDDKIDRWNLRVHVKEAEKWARKMLKKYPNVNRDVVLITLWLHDVGHYPITDEDHAIKSEKIAKEFLLKQKADDKLMKNILHCIRSHRNRDIKPETPEAKLFAMIDSISHLTYVPYFEMARDGRLKYAVEKLERDYRDIKPFPDILREITPLYRSLKNYLTEFEKLDLK